jgi:hypothetical protein
MTDENEFARDLQTFRNAIATMLDMCEKWDGELPELFADTRLPAAVFGQILMGHLPTEGLTVQDKIFWIEVMEHMGPDWVNEFRHVGGFMNKLGEF